VSAIAALGQEDDKRVIEFFVSKANVNATQEEHRAALREFQDYVTTYEGVLVTLFVALN